MCVCVRIANESSRLCLLDVARRSFVLHFTREERTGSFLHVILSVDKDDDDVHREFRISSSGSRSVLLDELRKRVGWYSTKPSEHRSSSHHRPWISGDLDHDRDKAESHSSVEGLHFVVCMCWINDHSFPFPARQLFPWERNSCWRRSPFPVRRNRALASTMTSVPFVLNANVHCLQWVVAQFSNDSLPFLSLGWTHAQLARHHRSSFVDDRRDLPRTDRASSQRGTERLCEDWEHLC